MADRPAYGSDGTGAADKPAAGARGGGRVHGGIRLRGTLRLREEMLFIEEERVRHLELLVDRTDFTYRDMESCVRLD